MLPLDSISADSAPYRRHVHMAYLRLCKILQGPVSGLGYLPNDQSEPLGGQLSRYYSYRKEINNLVGYGFAAPTTSSWQLITFSLGTHLNFRLPAPCYLTLCVRGTYQPLSLGTGHDATKPRNARFTVGKCLSASFLLFPYLFSSTGVLPLSVDRCAAFSTRLYCGESSGAPKESGVVPTAGSSRS